MNLNSLRLQLVQFGLNPREWRLIPRRQVAGRMEILVHELGVNPKEEAVQWVGWVQEDAWLSLKLADPNVLTGSERNFPRTGTFPRFGCA